MVLVILLAGVGVSGRGISGFGFRFAFCTCNSQGIKQWIRIVVPISGCEELSLDKIGKLI